MSSIEVFLRGSEVSETYTVRVFETRGSSGEKRTPSRNWVGRSLFQSILMTQSECGGEGEGLCVRSIIIFELRYVLAAHLVHRPMARCDDILRLQGRQPSHSDPRSVYISINQEASYKISQQYRGVKVKRSAPSSHDETSSSTTNDNVIESTSLFNKLVRSWEHGNRSRGHFSRRSR